MAVPGQHGAPGRLDRLAQLLSLVRSLRVLVLAPLADGLAGEAVVAREKEVDQVLIETLQLRVVDISMHRVLAHLPQRLHERRFDRNFHLRVEDDRKATTAAHEAVHVGVDFGRRIRVFVVAPVAMLLKTNAHA